MQTKMYLMMILLITQLAACTRAAKDSAKVSIALPSTLSSAPSSLGLTTLEIAHVSINATGAGISAPIVFSWDSCRDCENPPAPPTSFSLDVPSGTGRLIQILAVYRDPATEQMAFYYGDSTADLAGAEVTLDINVAPVGQGLVTSGRASGRYLTTATSGPTGIVDIKYNPGNNKPALIVDRGVIVNGWFNLFMLSGANLQYVIRGTNEKLWGQEMSFESTQMDPDENSGAYFDQRVRAYIPVHVRADERSGTVNYYPQEATTYVWGYWGPGAVGKKVCTSGLDSSPTTQKLKRYASSNLSSSPGLSVSHYINHGLAAPTSAQLNDTTNPYSTIVVKGGSDMSSSCGSFADTATNQFSNFQKVTLSLFDGNGNDNVAGFRGIFRSTGNGNFVNVTGSDTKNISGQVLPGVEAVFNGLRLYKRLGSEEFHMEAPLCSEIAAGAKGFVPASATDAVINSSGEFTLASNITATEASNGVSAVICPVYNGTLAPLGIFIGKWMFGSYGGGSGGGGGGGPATQLATVMFGNKVANDTCTPFFVEARDANNHPAYFNGSMDLTLTADNVDTVIYSDPTCATEITGPFTTNNSNQIFYVRRSATGAATRNLAITSSLPTLSQSLGFVDLSGTPFIMARVQPNINAYTCNTAAYISMRQNGADTMVADPGGSYTVNLPSTTNLNYFYPSGQPCSTPGSGSVYLNSTNLISFINFSYTGTATSISLDGVSASGSPGFSGTFGGASSVTVTQPGAATQVYLAIPNSFDAESCQSGSLMVVDSMHNPSPAPQAITIQLSYNGSTSLPANAGFYTDSSCSTPASVPSIAAATTHSPIYFRWPTSGALSITGTITSGPAGMSVETFNANVGPLALGSIIAYPANGVSFVWPNAFSGYAMPIQKEQQFNITLEARSPLGNILVGFNDTNPGPSGVNLHYTYSSLNCSPITWVLGSGTVTCSVPNAGDYFSSFTDYIRTGGGPSMYPPSPTGIPYIRISRAAEESNSFSFLLSQPFSYYANTCQPLLFARGQYTGSYFASSRVSSGMSYTAALSFGTGVTGFFSDPGCGSGITQATLGSDQSAAIVYAKMDGNTPTNSFALQADGQGATTNGANSITFVGSFAPSTFTGYKISMSLNQYYQSCSPVMVVRTDANGAAIPSGGGEGVTFSTTGFSAGWYSDATCSSALAGDSVTFNINETAKLVYIKPNVMDFTGGTVIVTNGTQTGTISGINGQP